VSQGLLPAPCRRAFRDARRVAQPLSQPNATDEAPGNVACAAAPQGSVGHGRRHGRRRSPRPRPRGVAAQRREKSGVALRVRVRRPARRRGHHDRLATRNFRPLLWLRPPRQRVLRRQPRRGRQPAQPRADRRARSVRSALVVGGRRRRRRLDRRALCRLPAAARRGGSGRGAARRDAAQLPHERPPRLLALHRERVRAASQLGVRPLRRARLRGHGPLAAHRRLLLRPLLPRWRDARRRRPKRQPGLRLLHWPRAQPAHRLPRP
jgi:hypothetical protein